MSAQARPVARPPAEEPRERRPRERMPLRERLAAWRDQHFYGLFSSLGRMALRPWSSLLTVCVLGFALALPLLFWLSYDNARALTTGMREAREVTVFLQPALDEAAAAALAAELRQRADVAAVTIRTPAQGLAEFRALSGFEDALAALGENPLPSVLVVMPASTTRPDAAGLLQALEADARVDLVQYDAVWRRKLSGILRLGARLVAVVSALLALATLLVIGNTVRMDIQARSAEISVMQTIGASNGFIRRPFLYAGFWYGVLGGLAALLLVAAVELALAGPIRALADSYAQPLRLRGIDLRVAAVLLGASSLLGGLGAWLVTTRHLLAGRPQ
ncbi:MAG: permease-like cell division protein FtsX [Dokdonella sp.]|uniref:permease-like cell division protein FtsX n=1 Tax=Dokdonella sp. TaxID=2291710 RepID=UPI0025C363E7|nr:permease-like cell division protein FtsX [Dokdonella sp.]MBX3701479.1 permease-like cell division protein FtsX [Dokdonella sp.]MCW5577182.1 permease-like cell division protein FtsX [Dokdonella sp.]